MIKKKGRMVIDRERGGRTRLRERRRREEEESDEEGWFREKKKSW